MPNTEDTGLSLLPESAWDTPWQTTVALFTGELVVPALIAVGKHVVRGAVAMFKRSTDQSRNTVLLVGLGRSGKTQLIQTLVGSNTGPPQRTLHFTVTAKEEILNGTSSHFHFIDYKGQDFGQLIRHLMREYPQIGEIHSLIMMVDLFPCVDGENPNAKFEQYSKERIKEHLSQWNTTSLDAVMGLLTKGSVRYVCLFVNKIDKLKGALAADDFGHIKNEYQSLIDDLERRVSDIAHFEVVVGSAQTGLGVFGPEGIRSKLAAS
jgi:GTPase SAR1 family protein